MKQVAARVGETQVRSVEAADAAQVRIAANLHAEREVAERAGHVGVRNRNCLPMAVGKPVDGSHVISAAVGIPQFHEKSPPGTEAGSQWAVADTCLVRRPRSIPNGLSSHWTLRG